MHSQPPQRGPVRSLRSRCRIPTGANHRRWLLRSCRLMLSQSSLRRPMSGLRLRGQSQAKAHHPVQHPRGCLGRSKPVRLLRRRRRPRHPLRQRQGWRPRRCRQRQRSKILLLPPRTHRPNLHPKLRLNQPPSLRLPRQRATVPATSPRLVRRRASRQSRMRMLMDRLRARLRLHHLQSRHLRRPLLPSRYPQRLSRRHQRKQGTASRYAT